MKHSTLLRGLVGLATTMSMKPSSNLLTKTSLCDAIDEVAN